VPVRRPPLPLADQNRMLAPQILARSGQMLSRIVGLPGVSPGRSDFT
jgi:hypothetical protein